MEGIKLSTQPSTSTSLRRIIRCSYLPTLPASNVTHDICCPTVGNHIIKRQNYLYNLIIVSSFPLDLRFRMSKRISKCQQWYRGRAVLDDGENCISSTQPGKQGKPISIVCSNIHTVLIATSTTGHPQSLLEPCQLLSMDSKSKCTCTKTWQSLCRCDALLGIPFSLLCLVLWRRGTLLLWALRTVPLGSFLYHTLLFLNPKRNSATDQSQA